MKRINTLLDLLLIALFVYLLFEDATGLTSHVAAGLFFTVLIAAHTFLHRRFFFKPLGKSNGLIMKGLAYRTFTLILLSAIALTIVSGIFCALTMTDAAGEQHHSWRSVHMIGIGLSFFGVAGHITLQRLKRKPEKRLIAPVRLNREQSAAEGGES